jgi:hypothetical protein
MTQQPNIIPDTKVLNQDLNLPVPRSLGSKKNTSELVSPMEEVFSIPSPDSGYALKLIKQFKHLWVDHYKGKLISKIVTNLVIYQASMLGRAPTKSDVVKVIEILEITENNLGKLDKDTLKICSGEKIQGLHLAELFNSNSEDKI